MCNMDNNRMIGKSCGEFTIQKDIGKGTFAHVYLVTRANTIPSATGSYQISNYAMKVINLDKANRREHELFDREIQILSDLKKFKHQNIVQYVECIRHEDIAYIIMEYCERGTLYEYIRQNEIIPEYTFIDYVRQIASGLEFLHSKNVLHRDLKSKNILLTGYNDIKIADFGVAREIPEGAPGKMSLFIGSPLYMSPEMLANQPYDEKTDIWSVGCTCFEMGTGDYAFKAENIRQIRKLIQRKQLPPMENAEYCDDVKSIIMWMLQKESADRPTAKQVVEVILSHKCKNITTHTTTEISKAVAKVAPRKKKQTSRRTDTMTSTLGSLSDTLDQQDSLKKQSNRYQAKIVCLLGDNKASEHVTEILRVCRKDPANYETIKETVKKYTEDNSFKKIYALVLALKGVEEAISSQEALH